MEYIRTSETPQEVPTRVQAHYAAIVYLVAYFYHLKANPRLLFRQLVWLAFPSLLPTDKGVRI